MKSKVGILATALLVAGWQVAIAQTAGTNKVSVTGCPVPGVEANCLVIRGSDNATYNISGAKPRPAIGQRAIRLTGNKTRKVSYCQQGIVLDNIAWSYTDQNCAGQ